MTTATERFEIGKTYCVGSRCDRVYFKVVARTARTATFELIGKQLDASRFDKPSIDIAGNGETQKVSLRVDDGAEYGTVKVEAKNAWGDHFTDRIYIEATKKFQVKLKKTATVEVDEYAVSTEAQDVAPKAEIEQAQAQTAPTIEYNEPLFDPFKFEAGRTYFRLNADGTPFTLKVEARTAHMLTGTTTEGTRKYKIGLNALGEYVQTGKDEDGYEQFIRARCEFIPAIVEIVKVTLEAFNEWAGKTPNDDPERNEILSTPLVNEDAFDEARYCEQENAIQSASESTKITREELHAIHQKALKEFEEKGNAFDNAEPHEREKAEYELDRAFDALQGIENLLAELDQPLPIEPDTPPLSTNMLKAAKIVKLLKDTAIEFRYAENSKSTTCNGKPLYHGLVLHYDDDPTADEYPDEIVRLEEYFTDDSSYILEKVEIYYHSLYPQTFYFDFPFDREEDEVQIGQDFMIYIGGVLAGIASEKYGAILDFRGEEIIYKINPLTLDKKGFDFADIDRVDEEDFWQILKERGAVINDGQATQNTPEDVINYIPDYPRSEEIVDAINEIADDITEDSYDFSIEDLKYQLELATEHLDACRDFVIRAYHDKKRCEKRLREAIEKLKPDEKNNPAA